MNKQTKIKHTTSVPSLQHIDMKTPSLQQPVLLQMQHLSYIRALFGFVLHSLWCPILKGWEVRCNTAKARSSQGLKKTQKTKPKISAGNFWLLHFSSPSTGEVWWRGRIWNCEPSVSWWPLNPSYSETLSRRSQKRKKGQDKDGNVLKRQQRINKEMKFCWITKHRNDQRSRRRRSCRPSERSLDTTAKVLKLYFQICKITVVPASA